MSDISYKDVATFFNSTRNMNKFIKNGELSMLIELRDKLNTSISDREIQQKIALEAEKLRNQKRTELMALIESEGFSLKELTASELKKNKSNRKMKYRYTENGIVKEWSGFGRTPLAIQIALKLGDNLSSFLIDKPVSNKNREEMTVFISDAKLPEAN